MNRVPIKENGPADRTPWKKAWRSVRFRAQLGLGLGIMALILIFFPFFFRYIEQRNGLVLNDWLLNYLPVRDVSLFIFGILWTMALLMTVRALQNPAVLLLFVWSFVLLCLIRIGTMALVALNPPAGLVVLIDPLSNTFYGTTFITKDLFFSGHTATLFLMFLTLTRPREKALAFMATLVVGSLVLVQHIHYTIDVLAAPLFCYLAYRLARRIVTRPAGR